MTRSDGQPVYGDLRRSDRLTGNSNGRKNYAGRQSITRFDQLTDAVFLLIFRSNAAFVFNELKQKYIPGGNV